MSRVNARFKAKRLAEVLAEGKAEVLAEVKAKVVHRKPLRYDTEAGIDDDFIESGFPEDITLDGNEVIVPWRFGDNSNQNYGSAEVDGRSVSATHHR